MPTALPRATHARQTKIAFKAKRATSTTPTPIKDDETSPLAFERNAKRGCPRSECAL